MNTNSNLYTVIYSAIIVTLVAAILAFVSQSLKPLQDANEKAETASQMLTAAHFAEKEELNALGNEGILTQYKENITAAFTINAEGENVRDLNLGTESLDAIELINNLKPQNDKLKKNNLESLELPVYVFNQNGSTITVVPVYGAGLWGPIWGYIALKGDMKTIHGAYFDHASETPGLGAKIKDEPAFRALFDGKTVKFENAAANENVFHILKAGVARDEECSIDAITGATMTCKGLDGAINNWLKAYIPYFSKNVPAVEECCEETECEEVGTNETTEE